MPVSDRHNVIDALVKTLQAQNTQLTEHNADLIGQVKHLRYAMQLLDDDKKRLELAYKLLEDENQKLEKENEDLDDKVQMAKNEYADCQKQTAALPEALAQIAQMELMAEELKQEAKAKKNDKSHNIKKQIEDSFNKMDQETCRLSTTIFADDADYNEMWTMRWADLDHMD